MLNYYVKRCCSRLLDACKAPCEIKFQKRIKAFSSWLKSLGIGQGHSCINTKYCCYDSFKNFHSLQEKFYGDFHREKIIYDSEYRDNASECTAFIHDELSFLPSGCKLSKLSTALRTDYNAWAASALSSKVQLLFWNFFNQAKLIWSTSKILV